MKPTLALACLSIVLSGCASDQRLAGNGAKSAALSSAQDDVAANLQRAQHAFDAKDKESLARTLAKLDTAGVQALDEPARRQLDQWRQAAGDLVPPTRGRVLGPGFLAGELPALGRKSLEQTFLSGRKAEIALTSPDNVKLEVTVTDSSDEPLCNKVAESVSCRWVPLYTHRHRIDLSNPNRRKARYYLVIE